MKKTGTLKRVLCFLVIGMIGVMFFSLHSYATTEEITEAEKAKEELEKKKEARENELAELEKGKEDVSSYIEKLDAKMEEIQAEINALETEVTNLEAEKKKTEDELAEIQKTADNQYDVMKERIKYSYENGQTDYLEILFDADNFGDLLSRAEYVAQISEYDRKLLQEYRQTKELIEQKNQTLAEKLEELHVLEEELALEEDSIEELTKRKEEELAQYEADIQDTEQEVAEYTKEIEKQEKLIEELLLKEQQRILEEERRKKEEQKRLEEQARQENAEQTKPAEGADISYRWPTTDKGRISSYFGHREQPIEGASTYHNGIDIAVASGTAIVAVADGNVSTATYSSTAGNYIMLYHGNGTFTVYMHCSELAVSAGQNVKQGDTIAYVGSTGISTGAHLHFGLSINGVYVNPLDYIS